MPILLFACITLLALCFSTPILAGEVLGEDFDEAENHTYAALPKLRVSAEYGFSKWLMSPDSITSSYENYLSRLEIGTTSNAELAYFFWPKGGVGVSWIWFLSRAKATDIQKWPSSSATHNLDERVSVTYIGPDFLTRHQLSDKAMLIGGLGVGYLFFHESGVDNSKTFSVTAENFAIQAHVGADYAFVHNLALGLEGRFFFSNIREYNYNGIKYKIKDPNNQFIWYNVPLYRLELSAGLHLLL